MMRAAVIRRPVVAGRHEALASIGRLCLAGAKGTRCVDVQTLLFRGGVDGLSSVVLGTLLTAHNFITNPVAFS
jgi:hypothetical protein